MFVGVGAILDLDTGDIDTDEAVGFEVEVTSLTLALVTEVTPATAYTPAVTRKFTGLEIHDLGAELVGIDGLTAKVYDGDVSVNVAADSSLTAGTAAQKLNWDTFTATSGELPDLSLVNTTDLAVSGSDRAGSVRLRRGQRASGADEGLGLR